MGKKRRAKVMKRLIRWVKKNPGTVAALCAVLVIGGGAVMNMANKRLTVDTKSYQPLLGVIAQAESKGNYNAYFGNTHNTSVRFTVMTIAEVLEWQAAYVAQGSPSSAVGRYQFLNTTLESLVNERGIDTAATFDEKMQDSLAAYLLERRGSEAYINQELSKQDFAANLAKEWASLPMIVGDMPEKSYYESDGLNKALVKPGEVLGAVDAVRAK